MKKAGYIIALILEAAFYIGAYVFNYYAKRKMGMSRYVVFLNRQIEEAVPIQAIIYAGAVVTALLLVISLVMFWKNRAKSGKLLVMMNGVSVIATGLYVGYALMNSGGIVYYAFSVFFLAAAFIQNVKTIIACLVLSD